MGTKNQQRRRAKQKARHDQQRQREARAQESVLGALFGGSRPRPDPRIVVGQLVAQAQSALHMGDEPALARCCDALTTGQGGTVELCAVDGALVADLQRAATATWGRGWQPADVFRLARRRFGARHQRIVVDVVAAEMRAYAVTTVAEQWESQLREAGAEVWWERDDKYISALTEREGLTRPEIIHLVVEVLYFFNTCPVIEVLCPPPGKARRGSLDGVVVGARAVDERQLDRVRALLAKAESTDFPEEAEAYTAKAQELMARHSIDYALLSIDAEGRDEPVGRRIGVDNPYEAPKVLLLNAVAGANRCRSVWSKDLGHVTVLGFVTDVEAVELLFTSLLVQATAAMVQAGSRRDAYGQSSTRSFRQSFLTAYAQRIGERLTEATQHATEQASLDLDNESPASAGSGADRLLPVLASREAAVGALADELFPRLSSRPVAATNREGWASGRAAADRARLSGAHPVTSGDRRG